MKLHVTLGWLIVALIPTSAFALPTGPNPPRLPPTTIGTAPGTTAGTTAATGPVFYFIHPYAVKDQCLGYASAQGPYGQGNGVLNAVMSPCNPGLKFSIVNYNDGKDWDGKTSTRVIIKPSFSNGVCLENASESLPQGGGDWELDDCASQVPTARYVFDVSVNANGAVSFKSENDQKCLERNGPNNVYAIPCNGLNNWMVEKTDASGTA